MTNSNSVYKNIFFLGIAFILMGLISHNAFKNGKVVCESYIMNTYLYIALGVCIIGYSSFLFIDNKVITKSKGLGILFMSMVLAFVFLFGLLFTSNENVIQSHIFWLLLIITFGITLVPSIVNTTNPLIADALLVTAIIFLSMSLVGYIGYEKIINHVGPVGIFLLICLIAVILYELFYIFFQKSYPKKKRRIVSYFVVVLFALFIIYDTVLLQKRAMMCSNSTNPANYPKESVNIILDLLNIFVRLLNN